MTGALGSAPPARGIVDSREATSYPSPLTMLQAAKAGDPSAYEALINVFARIRHPSLYSARSREARREIARELVHEYLASSATWTSERLLEVKTFSLFRRDLEKFFFGYEVDGAKRPGTEAKRWLKQKLDRVLAAPHFDKSGADRGRTARYRLKGLPEVAPIAKNDAELVSRLPRLRPRFERARDDRLPSYASDGEMDALMRRVFELNGNAYTYKKRLIAIALQCFEPPLEAFEYNFRVSNAELLTLSDTKNERAAIEIVADLAVYEARLDELLNDDERALLFHLELRGSELARLFGVSEARISQRREAIRSRLSDFAKSYDLNAQELSFLIGAYLTRLSRAHGAAS